MSWGIVPAEIWQTLVARLAVPKPQILFPDSQYWPPDLSFLWNLGLQPQSLGEWVEKEVSTEGKS